MKTDADKIWHNWKSLFILYVEILVITLTILPIHIGHSEVDFTYTQPESPIREQPLPNTIQDIQTYLDSGKRIEDKDPVRAELIYKKTLELSKKIDYKQGEIESLLRFSYLFAETKQLDSALTIAQEALRLARKINDVEYIAMAMYRVGGVNQLMGYDRQAIQYFMKTSKLLDNIHNIQLELDLLNGLIVLYTDLKLYQQAEESVEKAIQLATKNPKLNRLVITYVNWTYLLVDQGKAVELEKISQKGLSLCTEEDVSMKGGLLDNLAESYMLRGQYNKAIPYLMEAKKIAEENNYQTFLSVICLGLAKCFFFQNDMTKAQPYAQRALSLARHVKDRRTEIDILMLLSDIMMLKNNVSRSNLYRKRADSIQQQLDTQQQAMLLLAKKKENESQQKELQILQQNSQIKERSLIIQILVIGLVLVILVVILMYSNVRQKRRILEQTIDQLKLKNRLTTYQSFFQSEETERNRIARELEDKLINRVADLKLNLHTLSASLNKTSKFQSTLQTCMDSSDKAISEIRRSAQNLMPENILKYGLQQTLSYLISGMNRFTSAEIHYDTNNTNQIALDNDQALALYRIIQELLTNSIKHARAKHIRLHIYGENKTKGVAVLEDDGKGFAADKLGSLDGMGWKNIQFRVDYLKGKVDIQSTPQQGTTVTVEFPIQRKEIGI